MRIPSLVGLLSVVSLIFLTSQPKLTSGLAVMSVDLGSEWIKVAIVKPGVPMEIVLNKESRRKTPVSIGLRDDELLFGDPALSMGVKYPKRNYFYIQDLLAKPLDNPLVKLHQKRFPFYDMDQDEERGTVFFKHGSDLSFHPEELLAIALNKSRESAEDFAEQIIKDAVITVPAFFNQAERRSVLYAAELAGLRVLQLMNTNAAVSLNYGAFRRSDFNATAHNIMFYDMGAGSTTATIVSYQLVKTKEKGIVETNPQASIKGVGFDRTLGGLEWEIRLQQHLAKLFNDQGKTSNKVESSDRAMAKLLKEAKRVKKVLSANTDITSQIEGLLDDQDFRAHITRAELEEMCADLFERVGGPVDRALQASEMTMDEIDQVILVGGGTRIPKVQETLLKVTGKKELGKSINADEAAALGAVYQAAHLSKGFKVKKFVVKDANVYPIQVDFERSLTDDDGREVTRSVKRTLFGVSNPIPQKKVMTFNKHFEDFQFRVNYGDVERVMTPEDFEAFPSVKLTEVSLKGVKTALEKNVGSESKGIKAHFRMDESGILHLDGVESVFETVKNVTDNETQEEQSTLAKLGSTISRFFSGGSSGTNDEDTKTETEEEEERGSESETEADQEEKPETTSEEGQAEEGASDKDQDADQTAGQETSDTQNQQEDGEGADGKEGEDDGKAEDAGKAEEKAEGEEQTPEGDKEKEEKEGEEKKPEGEGEGEGTTKKEEAEKAEEKKETKPKVVTQKENITMEVVTLDLQMPSKDSKKASKNKLKELRQKEEERKERERMLNSLESFIFDAQEKLYEEDYEKCSTEEEREELKTKLSEASDWLYDQEPDVTAKVYKDKLKALKKLTKDLEFRVEEYRRRPELIAASKNALNASYHFLLAAKNLTGVDLLYTKIEVNVLEKIYNETNEWFTTKTEEQDRTPLTEKPVMLISDMEEKLMSLEREVRYLVNKAKNPPKKKKEKKTKTKTKANATETEDGAGNGNGNGSGNGETGAKEGETDEKVVIPPPEEGQEEKETVTEEIPETLELGGGEEKKEEEPTEATPTEKEEEPTEATPTEGEEEPTEAAPTEGEKEQKLEEPLQLEAPAEETTDSTQEDAAPTEGSTTTEEIKHGGSEHSHKNGDL